MFDRLILSKRKPDVKHHYLCNDVSNEKFTSKIFYWQTYLVTYVQNGKRLWISRRPSFHHDRSGVNSSRSFFCAISQ
jgi:hypothetical protein